MKEKIGLRAVHHFSLSSLSVQLKKMTNKVYAQAQAVSNADFSTRLRFNCLYVIAEYVSFFFVIGVIHALAHIPLCL